MNWDFPRDLILITESHSSLSHHLSSNTH